MTALTNLVWRCFLCESRHLAPSYLLRRQKFSVSVPRATVRLGFLKLLRGLTIFRLNLPAVDQESQSTLQNRARDQWLAGCVLSDREGGIDQLLGVFISTLLREIFFPVLFADFCSSENLFQGSLELLALLYAEYKFSIFVAGNHRTSPGRFR